MAYVFRRPRQFKRSRQTREFRALIKASVAVNLSANSGSFSLTGYPAGMNVNEPAGSGSFALTGYSASFSIGLAANSGSFTAIGYPAGMAIGEPAGSGSFALTGNAAGMSVMMAANSGSFAETGYSAALIRNTKLAANSGSFTATGFAAGMSIGSPVGSGSFSTTGFATAQSIGLPLGSGAFTLSGGAAAFSINMAAGSGSFVLTGYAAADRVGEPLGSGSFVLNAYAAGMAIGMGLGSGSFATTGYDAALTRSGGAVTWNPADKNPNITLSGGDLTATASGASDILVRATTSNTSGYFEITFGSLVGSGSAAEVGLANSSEAVSNYLGQTTGSVGWNRDGVVTFNNSFSTGHPGFAAGDVLGVELTTAPSIKFYKNGVLAYTYTGTMPTGALFPAVSLVDTDIATANFGATAMAHLPVGVTSWDGSRTPVNLAAGSGSFVTTGYPVSFGIGMAAGSGAFALNGYAAAFTFNRDLLAEAGSFVLTGYDALLSRTGVIGDPGLPTGQFIYPKFPEAYATLRTTTIKKAFRPANWEAFLQLANIRCTDNYGYKNLVSQTFTDAVPATDALTGRLAIDFVVNDGRTFMVDLPDDMRGIYRGVLRQLIP